MGRICNPKSISGFSCALLIIGAKPNQNAIMNPTALHFTKNPIEYVRCKRETSERATNERVTEVLNKADSNIEDTFKLPRHGRYIESRS